MAGTPQEATSICSLGTVAAELHELVESIASNHLSQRVGTHVVSTAQVHVRQPLLHQVTQVLQPAREVFCLASRPWFSAEIRDEHDEVVRQLGHRWVTL